MIRIATENDVPQMLAIYAPYILNTTHTFEYDVPSQGEFLQRFRDLTKQFPWLVWEEDGKVLGYAYGSAPFARSAYGWCAEDSIYLLPEAQGRGIGSRLCLALEKVLFLSGLSAYLRPDYSRKQTFHGISRKTGLYPAGHASRCGHQIRPQSRCCLDGQSSEFCRYSQFLSPVLECHYAR